MCALGHVHTWPWPCTSMILYVHDHIHTSPCTYVTMYLLDYAQSSHACTSQFTFMNMHAHDYVPWLCMCMTMYVHDHVCAWPCRFLIMRIHNYIFITRYIHDLVRSWPCTFKTMYVHVHVRLIHRLNAEGHYAEFFNSESQTPKSRTKNETECRIPACRIGLKADWDWIPNSST